MTRTNQTLLYLTTLIGIVFYYINRCVKAKCCSENANGIDLDLHFAEDYPSKYLG